jgi:hypothetical protein
MKKTASRRTGEHVALTEAHRSRRIAAKYLSSRHGMESLASPDLVAAVAAAILLEMTR